MTEAAALLFRPALTLVPEGPRAELAVLVRDGRIERVGPAAQLARDHADAATLDLPDRLLMPGLIDAHHHLTQSLGKALAFGEPSEIFRRIWVPMETVLDERALYVSAKLACLEALRGGFTTVVEAGTRSAYGVAPVVAALDETGIRCVLGAICNDHGPNGPVDETAHAALLMDAAKHLARFEHHARIHPSLAISVPEAATDATLGRVAALCEEAGCAFQTHANEHLVAVERSLVARGLRPIEHLDAAGALGPRTLLAHATLMAPNEIVRVRDTDAAIAYNPVATVWKGNAALDGLLMHALGVPFGLGTDGTRADGFRLLDAAETIQRVAHGLAAGDSYSGGGALWLDHATSASARAVSLGDRTGAIRAGAAADLLVVRLDVPELTPSWDLAWEAVRYFNRDQIERVYVAGVERLRDGWPLDWDARALLAEARTIAATQVARAPIQKVRGQVRISTSL
jgi:5-methylthioadenosine/S-adenosylhomocysteine deaminase